MYFVNMFYILQDIISTEQSTRAHKLLHSSYCTGSRIGIMGYIDNLRQDQKLRSIPNSLNEEWRRFFSMFENNWSKLKGVHNLFIFCFYRMMLLKFTPIKQ